MRPHSRVRYHSVSYHIQIDIYETPAQVFARLYRRCVIPVFLKSPIPTLSSVELLRRLDCDSLETLWNHLLLAINDQWVNMVRRNCVIEDL